MKLLASYSPPLVLVAWAALAALGCEGVVLTIAALVLLMIALRVHFRIQMERHVR